MHVLKYSNKAREVLENNCKSRFEGKIYQPIVDCKTRWNSTYAMLARAHQLQPVLVHVTAELPAVPFVHNDIWIDVRTLLLMLSPMASLTSMLCNSQYPNICSVVDMLMSIMNRLDQIYDYMEEHERSPLQSMSDDAARGKRLRGTASNKPAAGKATIKRLATLKEAGKAGADVLHKYYHVMDLNQVYIIIAMLDPAINIKCMLEEEGKWGGRGAIEDARDRSVFLETCFCAGLTHASQLQVAKNI